MAMTKHFEGFQEPHGYVYTSFDMKKFVSALHTHKKLPAIWYKRGDLPVGCFQVQLRILLKTKKPHFLTQGLKRRLCRKPSFPILSFPVSCWIESCRLHLSRAVILETCGSRCWGGWADNWVLEGQEVSNLQGKQCLHHHQDSSAVFLLGRGEGFSLWWTRPVAARGFSVAVF